tara:strand:- start:32035 stop:32241 length:207 start_codon:yes stop_codon:yes gene_type:complete
MADVPEYDGYLEIDEDQIRESFIQLNENVRFLQKRLKDLEDSVSSSVSSQQALINNLDLTKSDSTHSH